ncbi:MAG: hypothetical protein HYX94_10680 [Chloroflexi bacterium]|nr:hypothetical protein [Chloroflexota bacterium]
MLGRRLWLVFLILPMTVAIYLGYVVWLGAESGFPLDDAWIHQTFARNLVERGEFAFNPGQASTASTSPLWTALLGAGYLVPNGSLPWAYALGLLCLGSISWLGYLLAKRLFPGRPYVPVLSSVALLLEWRLDWAALSGMETLLFSFLCLAVIYLVAISLQETLSPFRLSLLGAAAGLATAVRPEGAVLVFLAFAALIWRRQPWRRIVLALGVAFLPVLPVAVFNQVVSGTPLPSTFYAKQAAYAGPLSLGFGLTYLVGAVATLASGPLLVLLPGVAFAIYRAIVPGFAHSVFMARFSRQIHRVRSHRRGERPFAPTPGDPWPPNYPSTVNLPANYVVFLGLWTLAMIGLYMVKLPALFHHGRYLMPLIPPLVVVGAGGLAGLLAVSRLRILARLYGVLAALVFLVLWLNGAVVYGWDVKFITDEQVETARWLRDHTPAGALVATHDIGAIGYLSDRTILDTAGLITPELGPYVRDQQKILSYLEARKADYLAVFPKWYPSIVADPRFEEVFGVDQPYAVPAGADNMRVYRPKW